MQRDSIRSSKLAQILPIGALSSGLLLYGASLIYGFTGAMNYGEIASALSNNVNNGAVIEIVFLVAGMAFKISARHSICGPRCIRRLAHHRHRLCRCA